MSRLKHVFLVPLVALAALPTARARSAKPPAPGKKKYDCELCKDTHRIPCRSHTRRRRRPQPFCSACCGGVRWTPCPKCADDATKATFEAIKAMYAKERGKEGFFPWGEGFFLAACEHFRFKAMAVHRECHQFHDVAERAFGLFLRVFGEEAVDRIQWHEKGHFLILESRDQFHELLNWYQKNRGLSPERVEHLRGSNGVRMIGDRLQVLIRPQTGGAKADLDMLLHRIAHGAGHLAIENYIGIRGTPDWWNEGWAGLSEIEALGRPAVYCITYVAGGHQARKAHEWKTTVRDALRKKAAPAWEKLFGMNVGAMDIVQWSTSISIVAWMVEKFPNKTVRFVDALRAGKSSKEAFEHVFERELPVIEKAWQKWAKRYR